MLQRRTTWKKQILSAALALLMLLGSTPQPVLAAAGEILSVSAVPLGATARSSAENPFAGKTLSILGDSISTYTGVSNNKADNPTLAGGAIYYTAGRLGVYREDTWWQQTADQLGMNVLVNNSWSGSAMLNTRSGTVGAYLNRCVQLHNAAGEDPDIIAYYLGTNDFSEFLGGKCTLGTADMNYAALISQSASGYVYATPTTVCEAYAIALHKTSVRYPDAEIYCLTPLVRTGQSAARIQYAKAFNEALQAIAAHFGAIPVNLYQDTGILDNRFFSTYVSDNSLHPGPLGMDAITGCLVSAMLEHSRHSQAQTHSVTYTLSDMMVEQGTVCTVAAGEAFRCSLRAPAGYETTVSVTMGGKDVTADCYQNGKIHIPSVTGDIAITAASVKQATNYRWAFSDSAVTSVTEGDNRANALTKLGGSLTDGVLQSAYFQMAEAVALYHHRPWVVEWSAAGNWSGMLLSKQQTSTTAGNEYFFKSNSVSIGLIAFGQRQDGQYLNYGIQLADHGVDPAARHIYRLENRIAKDGSNAVHLLVDGVDFGAMTRHYIGTNGQGSHANWANGRDLTFGYIGTNGHALTGCDLDYLQIWEAGDAHAHTYQNGVCTVCGAKTIEYIGTTEGTYINSSMKNAAPDSATPSYCIDKYRVTPECRIQIVARIGQAAYCAWVDADGNRSNALRGNSNSGVNVSQILTVPNGAVYLEVSYSVNYEHYIGEPRADENYGAKIGLLGDSIAAHGGFLNTIQNKLCRSSGKNVAIGGWFYSEDVCVNAEYPGDATRGIYRQIQNLTGDENLIILWAGTNDFGHSHKIGTMFDDQGTPNLDATTFYGGMHRTIRDLRSKFGEDVPIILCTPLHRNMPDQGTAGYPYSSASANKLGYYLGDYIDAMAAIAAYYDLLMFDSNAETKLDPNNQSINAKYFSDGLHPNAAGHAVIGDALAQFIVNTLSDELGYSYTVTVTAPTCTEQGYTTHTCACGDRYVDNYIDAQGHSYNNGVCAVCQTVNPLYGKNVSILGDSISTFAGVSQCASPYYNGSNRGVQSVYDTWWGKLIEDHGMSLCVNYSQGGIAMFNSVVYNDRTVKLHTDRSSPDIIFVFLGHNDKLEQVKPFEDVLWSTIIQKKADGTYTYATPDSFTEAYVISVHKMLAEYPAAEIVLLQCLTDGTFEKYNQMNPIIQAIGDKFGLTVVDFYGKGLSRENKTYFPSDVHPNKAGMNKMTEILEQVLENTHLHSFNAVVTPPTCTEQGYTTHTCACGDRYVDDVAPAKGHKFTHYIGDGNATLYADGTKTALCDHGCGAKDTVADVGSMLFPEQVTSQIYPIADGWLTGAPEGTTVQTLLSGLDWGKYCAVFRADGQPVAADAAVGTGMVLKLQQNGQTKQSVTIVVMGDTSGDGAVNETDLAQVRNHLLQAQQLTGAFAKAADCSGDGVVSVTDIIRLQALLLR